MKVTVIRNPVAGGAGAWPQIAEALARVFPGYALVETERGRTAAQTRAAVTDATDLVLAVGGDGTVGQVVEGVLTSSFPQTPFAFLPGGTGSDFSRNFRWPDSVEQRLQAIATATPRRIDVGLLQCRGQDGTVSASHFINIASAGVSGEMVEAVEASRGKSRLPASLRYRLIALQRIFGYRGGSLRISVDGRSIHDGPVLVAAFCNGGWFGAGVAAAPDAMLDDGLLEVVICRHRGLLGNLSTFAAFSGAGKGDRPATVMDRGGVIEIEPTTVPALSVEADGEVIQPGALRITVLPKTLTVKLPQAVSSF